MPIVSEKYGSLVATATRLFALGDYEGITTAEIAKDAGITEPLIYYHFSGKSGLYAHVVRAAHSLYQAMLNELPGSGQPAKRLNALLEAHNRFAKDHPLEATLVFRPVPPRMESGREDLAKGGAGARDDLKNVLAACIRDAIADGAFAEVNVAMTVDLLALLLFRLFELAPDKSIQPAGNALKAFCRRGLEARAN